MNLRTFSIYALILVALVLQTSCKSRSQVKDEPEPEKASRYELEELKNEVLRLSGRIEELQYEKEKKPEDNQFNTKMEERVDDLEKNQILILTEIKALKEAKKTPPKPKKSVKSLLKEAKRALKKKRYQKAEGKFRSVLSRSKKGWNASEAHYGLGETLYGQKRYKKAIVEYSKVQDVHAKSKKIAPSLYKIGLSFQKLKMPKEAQGFFAELVERYPKTKEARKARKKLKKK